MNVLILKSKVMFFSQCLCTKVIQFLIQESLHPLEIDLQIKFYFLDKRWNVIIYISIDQNFGITYTSTFILDLIFEWMNEIQPMI